MANWMLIEDFDSKVGTLLNLDLVPHVMRNADGSVTINISATHIINITPGKSAVSAWDYIVKNTVHRNADEVRSGK